MESNRADADAFVVALTGSPNAVLDFATFSDLKSKASPTFRIRGTLTECWERLVAANAAGSGVFITINESSGVSFLDRDIIAMRALFVDDDHADPPVTFETLQAAGQRPSITVQSGGGEHNYWLLQPGEDLSDFTPAQKALAKRFGTDPKISNVGRVMRLPGLFHLKNPSDPFRVEILQSTGTRFTVGQIVKAFGLPTGPAHRQAPKKKSAGPSAHPGGSTTASTSSSSAAGSAASFFEAAKAHARNDNASTFQGVGSSNVRPLKVRIAAYKRYLEKAGPAISGEGGDSKTFKLARVGRDFDLDPQTIFDCMKVWNETCAPPWTDEELADKIARCGDSAGSAPGSKASAPPEETATPSPGNGPSTTATTSFTNFGAVPSLAAEVFTWLQTYTEPLFEATGTVRLNIRSGELMIGAKVLSLDEALAMFQRNLGRVPDAIYHDGEREKLRKVPNEVVQPQLLALARQNAFDPVVEHLNELPPHDGVDRIPELLSALDITNPPEIYAKFLRKLLIGGVARALNPGCKLDTMLVLQDEHGGKLKSTLFRVLAGRSKYGQDFFSDTKINAESKDSLMLLNRFWFLEWSEMTTLALARSREAALAFVSSQEDSYRAPYMRSVEHHPRRSIFVGSTNKTAFLEAAGGNRRFWVIPNVGTIDVDKIKGIRDQLWAQALAEHRGGATWWLDAADEAVNDELLEDHIEEEIGDTEVAKFVSTRESVTVNEILVNGPEIFRSSNFLNRRGQMATAKILKSLGWHKDKRRTGAATIWVWTRGPKAAPRTERASGGLFDGLLNKERSARREEPAVDHSTSAKAS